MAQKWTDQASSQTGNRMNNMVSDGCCQLSDGTLVWLETDGNGNLYNVYLNYSTDHATVTNLATLHSTSIVSSQPFTVSASICVDASDNIYLFWVMASQNSAGTAFDIFLYFQVYQKVFGSYVWTAEEPTVAEYANGGPVGFECFTSLTWVNYGSSVGALIAAMSISAPDSQTYVSVFYGDASKLMTGSAWNFASYDTSVPPASVSSGQGVPPGVPGWIKISSSELGGTSGLLAFIYGTSIGVFPWTYNTTLTLNISTAPFSGTGTVTPGNLYQRFALLNYGANLWALVYADTNTPSQYAVALCNSTSVGTPVSSGAPTNLALPTFLYNWGAYVDPVTTNQIWVISEGTTTAQLYRLSCALGSGTPIWSTLATSDDTLSPWYAGNNTVLRVVESPRTSIIDWQVFAETSSGIYALLGDYTTLPNAPSAPTLTSPANGSYTDVSGGQSFAAIYNSTDEAQMNAYAMEIEISGASSESYWNASTSALQSSIVWNVVSVPDNEGWMWTLPGGVLTNGYNYIWSAASQEASQNLQGSFASTWAFTSRTGPVLVVTGPTGGGVGQIPTITWTVTPPAGTSQSAYEIIVESGSYGTSPGSGTTVYDSGTVASSATSQQLPLTLTNSTSFRAFVQITVTGGQTSAWEYTTFSVLYSAPATPSITPTAGTDPSTGAPAVALLVQGYDNYLSFNQSALGNGDTTGWVEGAGTKLTPVQSPLYSGNTGNYAMMIAPASEAVGSLASNDATGLTTLAVSPQTVGDVLVLSCRANTSAASVTSIAGGGVTTWTKAIQVFDSTNGRDLEIWYGTVTTAGNATITITATGFSAVDVELSCQEFTANLGSGCTWSVDVDNSILNTTASQTVTYPTLTPTDLNELYVGYAWTLNTAQAGTTTDYTYVSTHGSNQFIYNTQVNAATSPTGSQTASGDSDAVAVLLTASTTTPVTLSAQTSAGNAGIAVTASMTYSANAILRAQTTARLFNPGIVWSNSSGTEIGTTTTTAVDDSTTAFVQSNITNVSPPTGATYGALSVSVAGVSSTSDVHYYGAGGIFPLSNTSWSIGGNVGNQTAITQYSSDGVNYNYPSTSPYSGSPQLITNYEQVTLNPTTQQATIYHYEASPTDPTYYVTTISSQGANSTSSPAKNTQPKLESWWLYDMESAAVSNTQSLTAVPLKVVPPFQVQTNEMSATYRVLGRDRPIVVYDVVMGRDSTINAVVIGQKNLETLGNMISSQHILYLTSPYGHKIYIRHASTPGTSTSASVGTWTYNLQFSAKGEEYYEVSFDFVEVDKPIPPSVSGFQSPSGS